MNCTINTGFSTGPQTGHSPRCTPEQARELVEGLRAAYQSLLSSERIVFRGILTHAARTQFTQEMKGEVPDTISC